MLNFNLNYKFNFYYLFPGTDGVTVVQRFSINPVRKVEYPPPWGEGWWLAVCTGWADCAQAVAQGEEGKHGQGDNKHAEQISEMKQNVSAWGIKNAQVEAPLWRAIPCIISTCRFSIHTG